MTMTVRRRPCATRVDRSQISQKRDNVVWASKKQWTPPVSFEVDMMASTAPGVASAVTWRGYQVRPIAGHARAHTPAGQG